MVTPARQWNPASGQHATVLIDTNIWMYHLEGNAEYGAAASRVIGELEKGIFQGVASELTLLELQVRPLRLNRQDVADEYEILLEHFPNLALVPVNRGVITLAALLRARYSLKTPDAIVLATGIRRGATLAISNDAQWQRVGEIATRPLTPQGQA